MLIVKPRVLFNVRLVATSHRTFNAGNAARWTHKTNVVINSVNFGRHCHVPS